MDLEEVEVTEDFEDKITHASTPELVDSNISQHDKGGEIGGLEPPPTLKTGGLSPSYF